MRKNLKFIYLFLVPIFLIQIISAATYCCEKTSIEGAWCQNVNNQTNCDTTFTISPAFCEATLYCKTGTCINQDEGTCMPSTEKACTSGGGYWSEKSKDELPQCKNGCCVLGDSTKFVTQIACNELSSFYGLEVNFQSNIDTELACFESANPNNKGACVFTENYVKDCELLTKKECQDKSKISSLSGVEFYDGFLCSAPELETICAKSQNTKCYNEKVYFLDTCGNLANVYDSTKINDVIGYWTKIQEPTCTTTGNLGNKESATCGDCDFYSGSTCGQKKIGQNVNFGNNICRDLDCKDYTGPYSGTFNYPHHGESWCETDEKNGGTAMSPGASSFVLTCYNGEVNLPTECDPTRQKICKETVMNNTNGFLIAGCKVNQWQDCVFQNKSEDCLDENLRDCNWVFGTNWNGYYFNLNEGNTGMSNINTSSSPAGICVPKYQPGFLKTISDATANCASANTVCYVKMKKWWLDKDKEENCKCDNSKPENNCSCLDSNWNVSINQICTSLGDCGLKKNYIGIFGYPTAVQTITQGNVN